MLTMSCFMGGWVVSSVACEAELVKVKLEAPREIAEGTGNLAAAAFEALALLALALRC